MKTLFCVFVLLLFSNLYHLDAQVLEIHQINVGQGDATLIVIRDTAVLRANFAKKGTPLPTEPYQWLQVAIDSNVQLTKTVVTAFLLDGGDSAKAATAIYNYITSMGLDNTQIKYFLLSHFHADHNRGFYDLMNKYKVYPERLIIRQTKDKGLDNGTKKAYKELVTQPNKDTLQVRPNHTELLLGQVGAQNIQLTCIGAAMFTAFRSGNLPKNTSSVNDENNFSVVWALQLGAFRYYTGGDLNGYGQAKLIDLESPLMDSLLVHDPATLKDAANNPLNKGHLCSLKLNHHGGEESTNPYFLAVMKPSTAMISCGQQSYKHPRQRVVQDLDKIIAPQWDLSAYQSKPLISEHGSPIKVDKTIQHYFMTNLNRLIPSTFYDKLGDPTQSTGIIAGDIVTIVDSSKPLESNYYVFWNGKKGTKVVSNPQNLYDPNEKGGKYIKCHQSATPPPYLVNH